MSPVPLRCSPAPIYNSRRFAVRVPTFRYFRLYFAAASACLLSIALTASFAHAQGFTGGITSGKSKKKVVL